MTELTDEIRDKKSKLLKAMSESINMDSLSTSIFSDFLTFIMKKVQKINEQPSYIPRSKLLQMDSVPDDTIDIEDSVQLEKLDNVLLYSARQSSMV